jgi:hypothetical protein
MKTNAKQIYTFHTIATVICILENNKNKSFIYSNIYGNSRQDSVKFYQIYAFGGPNDNDTMIPQTSFCKKALKSS